MQRLSYLLPAMTGLLLFMGCESKVEQAHQEAIDLTRQAQREIREQKFDEARQSLDKAIGLEPSADRYRLRAETHLNDLKEAINDINKGLELEPSNGRLVKLKETLEAAVKANKGG